METKKRRVSQGPRNRWTPKQTKQLLERCIKEIGDDPDKFEKPTNIEFYAKVTKGCSSLKNLRWPTLKLKLHNMKKSYNAALSFMQENGNMLVATGHKAQVDAYFEKNCTYFEYLDKIFKYPKYRLETDILTPQTIIDQQLTDTIKHETCPQNSMTNDDEDDPQFSEAMKLEISMDSTTENFADFTSEHSTASTSGIEAPAFPKKRRYSSSSFSATTPEVQEKKMELERQRLALEKERLELKRIELEQRVNIRKLELEHEYAMEKMKLEMEAQKYQMSLQVTYATQGSDKKSATGKSSKQK